MEKGKNKICLPGIEKTGISLNIRTLHLFTPDSMTVKSKRPVGNNTPV